MPIIIYNVIHSLKLYDHGETRKILPLLLIFFVAFFGPRCEMSMVTCATARDDMYGHWTCDPSTNIRVCLPYWTGPLCDERTYSGLTDPECSSMLTTACLNGGSCYQDQCICREGYTGVICEYTVGKCQLLKPCLNNGVCTDKAFGTGYTCTCPVGTLVSKFENYKNS